MENFPLEKQSPDIQDRYQKQKFLASIAPFKILPNQEIKGIAANLYTKNYSKDQVLYNQDETAIVHIIILKAGRLETSVNVKEDKEIKKNILEEGEIYGPISFLFNNGLSISTVRCAEVATVYQLDTQNFLRLCIKYPKFAIHFSRQIDEEFPDLSVSSEGESPESSQQSLALTFLRETAGDLAKTFPSCWPQTSIQDATGLLIASRKSAILINQEEYHPIGIVTNYDLCKKVIFDGRSPKSPVCSIMSAPLIQIDAKLPATEMILTMMQRGVKHLVVSEANRIKGVITEQDLLVSQRCSPIFLVHEVQRALEVDKLRNAYERLPNVIWHLIESGARGQYLNSIITVITDAVLEKLISMAFETLGPAPAKFAFLLLGSEGRKEQTLKTDQDNAIIFEDVSPEKIDSVRIYFLQFGTLVCDWLNEIGQKYCKFGIMAKNPIWCQPLSQWKEYYHRWLQGNDPERILYASIFFDFRLGYGNQGLLDKISASLSDKTLNWPTFLREMARNNLGYNPPLSFFGIFILKDRWKGKGWLDIKSAMRLLVDFGRIYALQYNFTETNTLKRLQLLQQQPQVDKKALEDIHQAYECLMLLRLKHQGNIIKNKKQPPDNLIQPETMNTIDQQTLKEAFKQIRIAQAKMRMDFSLYFP